MLRAAVAVAVAPGLVQVRLAALQPLQRIGQALVGLARLTIHIDQILTIGGHKPVGTATRGGTHVDRGIAYGVGSAVGKMDNRTVGSTHHHLGTTVAVPVIAHDILLVVLEVAHVRTAVHPPQSGTVLLQALENTVFALIAAPRIRGAHLAQVVELHQDFQLAVAVNVGTACIVGHQRTLDALVLQLDFLVAACPRRHRLARLLLLAFHDRRNGIRAGRRTRIVGIVRHAQRRVIHLHAVTVDVIRDIIILLAENAPAQVNASARLHGHKATVQLVSHTLRLSYNRHQSQQGHQK